MSELLEWIGKTNPDAWAAGAGWLTFTVAIVASCIAIGQLRDARKTRIEQAQPYVVAYMEPSPANRQIIDLVVRNFGMTAAYNVRMKSRPGLMRSAADRNKTEKVFTFKVLPILAPNQEWRTFWDAGTTRASVSLPDEYKVTITYEDSQERSMAPTVAILDWSMYKGQYFSTVYGVHDAAAALRQISASMKSWGEFGRGLAVYSRSGEKKDKRQRKVHLNAARRAAEISTRVLRIPESRLGAPEQISSQPSAVRPPGERDCVANRDVDSKD
jgi:hypothetical protein